MLTKETILGQLTGGEIPDELIWWMKTHLDDFHQMQQRYTNAIARLRAELGDPACDEEETAIRRQLNCRLLFAGFLGLQANLDHFKDPVARDFLDVDPEIYLREQTACRLPECEKAQKTRCAFYERLSPDQQRVYADVQEYTTYLETVGPKLAHYYGYILGNDILPFVIPGYHPDAVQTILYKAMLNRYLGRSVL